MAWVRCSWHPGTPTCRRCSRRRRGLVASVVVLVAALLTSACGVTTQSVPQPVAQNHLPVTATPAPPRVSSVVQVYLVRGGRLVPVTRSGRSTDDAITSLSAGPTALDVQADLETRIPPQSVALAPAQGGIVVVEVTSAFAALPDRDLFLAAAQLVWTATEICCATQVRVKRDNRALTLPTDRGAVAGPVRRDDYRSVAPV